jgi:hypothetical protein
MPATALRSLMLEVLKATDALDASTHLLDLDSTEGLDALIAGEIDVAIFPSQLDGSLLQRALGAPGIRLMNVAQAEAIAKTVPGLKHVVLWRGLISLARDIPDSDIDLLASRNRLLARKDLHPALQYPLLEAMREVHWPQGPFNRLGEFPSEQPNDLPLSPTAEAFYRSGPTFWQRYTSFWLTSLLNRIVFFVIPIIAALISVIGFAPRFYRWLHVRRIDQLHRALGNLERQLAQSADRSRFLEYQTRIAEIESAVRLLKVARPFEVDLQRLRVHLRMVQEDFSRIGVVVWPASCRWSGRSATPPGRAEPSAPPTPSFSVMGCPGQAVPPPGRATTSDAAQSRRDRSSRRCGTSSYRYQCRLLQSQSVQSEAWRARCLGAPGKLIAGGAGARPVHPILRHRRLSLFAEAAPDAQGSA